MIMAEGSSANRKIPAKQMQIGYKTYGPGHELSILWDFNLFIRCIYESFKYSKLNTYLYTLRITN